FFFFFFQAEDGIRDFHVTGVQTCALPISRSSCFSGSSARPHLTAAALSRCTATVLITSTAGTSAMSRASPLASVEFESSRSDAKIGRASCRERVRLTGVGVTLKERRKLKE